MKRLATVSFLGALPALILQPVSPNVNTHFGKSALRADVWPMPPFPPPAVLVADVWPMPPFPPPAVDGAVFSA